MPNLFVSSVEDIEKFVKKIDFRFPSVQKQALIAYVGADIKICKVSESDPNKLDVKATAANIKEYKLGSGNIPADPSLVSLSYGGRVLNDGNPFFPASTGQMVTKVLSSDGKCSVSGKPVGDLSLEVQFFIFFIAKESPMISRPQINIFWRGYGLSGKEEEILEALRDDYPEIANKISDLKTLAGGTLRPFKVFKERKAEEVPTKAPVPVINVNIQNTRQFVKIINFNGDNYRDLIADGHIKRTIDAMKVALKGTEFAIEINTMSQNLATASRNSRMGIVSTGDNSLSLSGITYSLLGLIDTIELSIS